MGGTKRVPLATYRLQFNRRFGFNDARRLLPYLHHLGIDTIYASPIFRARPGSQHGYDIVDPNDLNPDLGSERDFELLTEAVRERGMGWVQDIVPNHMAFHHDNHMLMGIFRLGGFSRFSEYFDIDRGHPDELFRYRLMAPFLERPYKECLERGDFKIHLGEDGLYVTYKHHAFTMQEQDYMRLFASYPGDKGRRDEQGPRWQDPQMKILASAIMEIAMRPYDPRRFKAGQVSEEAATIWRLYRESDVVRGFIDEKLESLKPDVLDKLLSIQRFRLTPWKEAAEVINYRRFFDVSSLICLATHKPGVFDATHGLVTELVEAGAITGLRIDHIDGLRLPESYLLQLRERLGEIYIIVEKVLAGGEQLRWWSVEGTTGYDFLNAVNGVFCRRDSAKAFESVYREFTGCESDPRDLLYEKKKLVMNANLKPELDNLARWFAEALEDTAWKEIVDELPPAERLREALVETLAELPVYRTYMSPANQSWHDGVPLAEAIGRAETRNPHLAAELRLLTTAMMAAPRLTGRLAPGRDSLGFAMTLQQYTGAVMAKGFEDTFLYVYNRLISLNEVGGDPIRFGSSLADFHAFNLARGASHPHSMSATSTHDTKRGEDARARINVLSEIPGEWEEHIKHWAGINASKKTRKNGEEIPDRNDEYFLYQTLIGSYPFGDDLAAYRYRIARYVRKAAREAKVHTYWGDPDTSYEDGYAAFAESILTPGADSGFLADFLPFQRRIAHYGVFNSLSQTLIKICAPGVPDFYQGAELWNLNLVDPDNRGPVDYGARVRMLDAITKDIARDPADAALKCQADIPGGRIKLFLIHKALAARKANPYLLEKGTYTELRTDGEFAEHVIAFARAHKGAYAICVVPRFLTGIVSEVDFPFGREVWGDTTVMLPDGPSRRWTDAITGQPVMGTDAIHIGDLLRLFPVSLLMEDNE